MRARRARVPTPAKNACSRECAERLLCFFRAGWNPAYPGLACVYVRLGSMRQASLWMAFMLKILEGEMTTTVCRVKSAVVRLVFVVNVNAIVDSALCSRRDS